ncbi:MAG: DUF481 domain-containing protein [Deltaproteobacteria bacterium]|nr:DUF481 domain-containing protein [Deltaproteobacteria bacterium]
MIKTVRPALLAALLFFCSPVLAQNGGDDSIDTQDAPETDVTGDVQMNEDAQAGGKLEDIEVGRFIFHNPHSYSDSKRDKWKWGSGTKAGFNYSAGNTRNIAIAAMERLLTSKGLFHNTVTGGVYYSQSALDPTTPMQSVNRFYFVKEDLEWHLHPEVYAFSGGGWERDEAAGLTHNYSGNIGAGRYFIDTLKVILQGEAGYQYNNENFTISSENQHLHSALAGLNATWLINPNAHFDFSLVTLTNLKHGKDFRVVNTADLTFRLVKHLWFGAGFHLRFDNRPVTGFKKYDTTTTAALLFKI